MDSKSDLNPHKPSLKKKLLFGFLALCVVGLSIALGWIIKPTLGADAPINVEELTSVEIDNLYELFTKVTAMFNTEGIDYWLVSGSLIGAMRHIPPGPMAWDDDIDVGVFDDQLEKIEVARGKYPELDILKDETGFGYQIALKDKKSGVDKDYQLDIFVFVKRDEDFKSGGDVYRVQNTNLWPGMKYEGQGEVFPTQDCYLYDIKTRCPRLSGTTLKREFGDNVLEVAYKYNHKSDDKKTKHDLTADQNRYMLLPAMSMNMMSRLSFNTTSETRPTLSDMDRS